MTDWYKAEEPEEQARLVGAWVDAPTQNTETCGFILSVALGQVWAFAPESDSDEEDEYGDTIKLPIPDEAPRDELVYAQLKQAENLWNAGRTSSEGGVGMDGFTFTPRPLDKTIRGIIRPVKGRFSVG